MSEPLFHPAVSRWFQRRFGEATAVQDAAWQSLNRQHPTLIVAPTGSGKTLAGFLTVINRLVEMALSGDLDDRIRVVYVSPLRALSNDIERNLREPLSGILDELRAMGVACPEIRAQVRTGDTPQNERQKMRRRPPHILVTTPESLFIMLTADSGRAMLSRVETILVDEIHAIAGSKRGAHLALSLQRLTALASQQPLRVGLSATVKPLTKVAQWLTGDGDCQLVDHGHRRQWDLAMELADEPLGSVLSNQAWEAIYDRLAELIEEHRTTLIFSNTRRLAERAARHLSERMGEGAVTAHHGSLSREHRLETEARLKSGELRAVVATASLELGIDVGHIDLVCQLGSPRAISALLQRVGRAGHRLDRLPKGRVWPLSRDDLVECAALLDSARQGYLDQLRFHDQPLDVLSQHIVSMATQTIDIDALYQIVQQTWDYRELSRQDLMQVVDMLAGGYSNRRGRRLPWVEWDKVQNTLRSRRHVGSVVMMNAGAIPDHFDYDVWLMPEESFVGTLNEDFAFESLPGDIFQLGNQCYRILKVESGRVLVEDAAGAPPNIPFWFGEAPGRSDELSRAVSDLRADIQHIIESVPNVAEETAQRYELKAEASRQLVEYMQASYSALACLPTQNQVVIERFFDETDDYHLVIHSPFGARLNRAWGLSLRKRFCRRFNFELQAAAVDDAIILSLGSTHSFPLEEILTYLKAETVRDVLTQAVLDAPMFNARWRWNATTALAVLRMRHGKRIPAQFQRNDAEDLMALVFPDSLACLENISGEREVPEHPLVRQTLRDCLEDTMDIAGLESLLRRIENQSLQVRCLDLNGPSPLAREILTARPWAFLDDGAAEERRTLAVRQERHVDRAAAAALARPEEDAIEAVRRECIPVLNSPDDLHDALSRAGYIGSDEASRWGGGQWQAWFQQLCRDLRASCLHRADGQALWTASERAAELLLLWPESRLKPSLPDWALGMANNEEALCNMLLGRLQLLGAATEADIQQQLNLPLGDVTIALTRLEREGALVRITAPTMGGELWCLRHLGARIRRLSREQRRGVSQPASPRVFLRMLLARHGLSDNDCLPDVDSTLHVLEGWGAPINIWEQSLLATRMDDFGVSDLDLAMLSGGWAWRIGRRDTAALVSASPITLLGREHLSLIGYQESAEESDHPVLNALRHQGALFMADLREHSRMLQPQLETSLRELAGASRVHADSWSALRQVVRSDAQKRRMERRIPAALRRRHQGGIGRWSLLPPERRGEESLFAWARILLRRYGVLFRLLLERETLAPPWSMLLRVLRRLEDQGEILGGRFVTGVSGEQYALPEAAAALKRLRKSPGGADVKLLHSYDPLAWAAVVAGAPRLPLANSHVLVLRGDTICGWHMNDEWHWISTAPPGFDVEVKAFKKRGF